MFQFTAQCVQFMSHTSCDRCYLSVSQCKIHRRDKEQCTAKQPSGTCSVLSSPSCSHNVWVPYKLAWLLLGLSSILPSLPQPSSSTPIHLEMEALKPWSSSGPSSDQPGRQPSWCDVLYECSLCMRQTINCSAFLREQLVPCLVDTLLATGVIVSQDHKSLQWPQPFLYGL